MLSENRIYAVSNRNKTEFEKVIQHYSKSNSDSLKLKASLFLIDNIDGHSYYYNPNWKEFCDSITFLFSKTQSKFKLRKSYRDIQNSFEKKLIDYKVYYDEDTLTADYLIKNIDEAFENRRRSYNHFLSFSQFCEFLLPYRVGSEEPIEWRQYFKSNFEQDFFKRMKDNGDTLTAKTICKNLANYFKVDIYPPTIGLSDFDGNMLSKLKIGTCNDYTHLAVFAARSIGIPVGIDIVQQWGTKNSGHSWNVLIDENNKIIPFSLGDSTHFGKHLELNPLWIPPKIFRNTFEKQKESLILIRGDEDIPDELSSPYMKDVTLNYVDCKDMEINIDSKISQHKKFAYICVFDNQNWIPVYWGNIKNQKVVFKNMNTGLVYLPCIFSNGNLVNIDYPAILSKNGAVKTLKPDFKRMQTLTLKRKYTDILLSDRGGKWAEKMVGGKFQLANDSAFKDAIDIYIIDNKPEISFQIINLNLNQSFKFFRYLSPPNSYGAISEIELYEKLTLSKIKGKILGTSLTKEGYDKNNVFDGNVLTGFESIKPNRAWVGLEFDNPKQIDKLVYLPRNDDNFYSR